MLEHGAMDQSMNFSEQVETNNSIGEPPSFSHAELVVVWSPFYFINSKEARKRRLSSVFERQKAC